MKVTHRLLLCLLLLFSLALPAIADEAEEDLEKDARMAESAPPVIPHRVDVTATGEACLACHRDGIKGAPATSHPERLDCVQCHVQGEVKTKLDEEVARLFAWARMTVIASGSSPC